MLKAETSGSAGCSHEPPPPTESEERVAVAVARCLTSTVRSSGAPLEANAEREYVASTQPHRIDWITRAQAQCVLAGCATQSIRAAPRAGRRERRAAHTHWHLRGTAMATVDPLLICILPAVCSYLSRSSHLREKYIVTVSSKLLCSHSPSLVYYFITTASRSLPPIVNRESHIKSTYSIIILV